MALNPHKSKTEALEKLEKLEKAQALDEAKRLVGDLEQSKFFTDAELETVEAQTEVRKKIESLLENVPPPVLNPEIDKGLKELLKLIHPETIKEKKQTAEDKKDFLMIIAQGALKETLGPAYEILGKDQKIYENDPEMLIFLKQIQSACKTFIEGIDAKKLETMSLEDQGKEVDRIKKEYENRIEKYIDSFNSKKSKAQLAEEKAKAAKEEVDAKAAEEARAKEEADAKRPEKIEERKQAAKEKKGFLMNLSSDLEELFKPVYEILEKDQKDYEEKPERLELLKNIQSAYLSFIDKIQVEKIKQMDLDEKEATIEQIKNDFNALSPKIKNRKDRFDRKEVEEAERIKVEVDKKAKEEAERAEAEAKAARDEAEKASREAKEKMDAKVKADRMQKLTPKTLVRGVLIKPEEYKKKSKNPVIRAIIKITKDFDKEKLNELDGELGSSNKIPSPSQAEKIRVMRAKGITTSDELDKEMTILKDEISKGKREIKMLDRQITLQTTTITAMRGDKGTGDKEGLKSLIQQLGKLNDKLTEEDKRIGGLEDQLDTYKEIQPFIGGNKLTPRQLLLKIIKFKKPELEKDLQALGKKADKLIAIEENKGAPENKWDKLSRFIKPSLKATLKELIKAEELESLKPEDMEELVKVRDDPRQLATWVDKLKEKDKTVVPALMAYLQIAVVEGKLNILSRGQAINLLRNLRSIRDKRILKEINGNPELLDAKPQVRMQAYLKEMNQWDEKSVQVNHAILDDFIKKSYAKKAGLAVAGAVGGYCVLPWIGLSAITSAISYIGWGTMANIGIVGAHAGGKKMVKTFAPEAETAYKHTMTRLAGVLLLGPLGLAAPELISGAKFLFTKRKEIKKGAIETGAAVAATAGTTWAITSGTGKALAWPFKKIFGKSSPEPMHNVVPMRKAKPKSNVVPMQKAERASNVIPMRKSKPLQEAEPTSEAEQTRKAA